MKKVGTILISAVLSLSSIGAAQAHDGERFFRPPMPYYEHHHHHDRGWIGPAAVLAITGLAIGTTIYQRSYAPPPQVIYTAPPPNPNIWYYCGSSGQYYPYTNACPEGWQAVPGR